MEIWQFLGNLHPKLVQFPLVLLPLALILDAAGLLRRSDRAHWAAKLLTTLGTLIMLLAFICGIYAEIWAGRAGIPHHPIELHELMANIAAWGFVLLLAWRLFLTPQAPRRFTMYIVAGLTWYVLLALTAWLGGQLVFEYGAAVTGAVPSNVLSLGDLNTLATRQTDENLLYSEQMHHIFGWITLTLAASLILQAAFPTRTRMLRWISPLLFLAGGIFLFFRADLDLYPDFLDPRQWRDREVLLHKALSLIMFIVGVTGLWKTARSSTTSAHSPVQSPAEAVPASPGAPALTSLQSRIVAVMALIGGAMLFTHVHTVAPYANVAAGVYIAHVVLGSVALSIGGARLAQDYWPRFKRPLAATFACLLALEGVLLVTYNEGLPWYIGYGRYNRWGPHGGTVAPYGDARAELVVDAATGVVDVYVLDRFTSDPKPVHTTTPITLLVARQYREVAIPLAPMDESRTPPRASSEPSASAMDYTYATHFRGRADFLTATPAFSARLSLPLRGKDIMGYFDPWVTPAITPIPPNEVANYCCPMHDGIRTKVPGACPLCSMELLPIDRQPRPTGSLHDASFAMDFAANSLSTPDRLPVGTSSMLLRFTPRKDNTPGIPLAIVHTQPLHLLIVARDLSFFDHVHPVPQPDGSLTLAYAFPRIGQYLLFADITPRGDRNQVFRIPITVTPNAAAIDPGPAAAPTRLTPDPALAKLITPIIAPKSGQDSAPLDSAAPRGLATSPIAPVHVQLVPQPRKLYAGLHTHLLFKLSDAQDRPITDLRPYLGAMGHCVIISEDGTRYVHSHPEQLQTPDDQSAGGPDIAFHTTFPAPGRYKIFGQFLRAPSREGEPPQLLIADFNVEVQSPPVPAALIRYFLDDP